MSSVPEGTDALKAIREGIDRLDQELIALLVKRMKLSKEIGQLKGRLGGSVYDPAREHSIMEVATKAVTDPCFAPGLREILREVISACRKVQNGLKVYYLGPEGSYCHQALMRFMGRSVAAEPAQDIEEVFSLTEACPNGIGLVPIENSLEGPLTQTYDLLMESHLLIQGEIYLPIRLSLLGHTQDLTKAKRIVSHPYAFAQVRDWLRKNLGHLELMEVPSTSRAAYLASKDKNALAIGPSEAASIYGLRVLKEIIPMREKGITRFVLLGHTLAKDTGQDKTSICFTLSHRPGTLHQALGAFSDGINLCLILSRPIKARPWEYAFFVDFEGHAQDPRVQVCLRKLQESTLTLRILGSYPKGASC